MTQQIKTVIQNFGKSSTANVDEEINALLSQGWTILNISSRPYNDEYSTYADRTVVLVRDVKSAPESANKPAYKFNIGDTVTLIKPSESRKFEESRRDHTGAICAQLSGIDANQYVVDFSQDEYNDALVLEEWQLELFWRRGE